MIPALQVLLQDTFPAACLVLPKHSCKAFLSIFGVGVTDGLHPPSGRGSAEWRE